MESDNYIIEVFQTDIVKPNSAGIYVLDANNKQDRISNVTK